MVLIGFYGTFCGPEEGAFSGKPTESAVILTALNGDYNGGILLYDGDNSGRIIHNRCSVFFHRSTLIREDTDKALMKKK